MYTLRLNYSGGQHKIYTNIEKIEYQTFLENVSISGDEILRHTFTMGHDMHLFSKDQKYFIPRQGIVAILASKEGS